jgi:hypothetical protein
MRIAAEAWENSCDEKIGNSIGSESVGKEFLIKSRQCRRERNNRRDWDLLTAWPSATRDHCIPGGEYAVF